MSTEAYELLYFDIWLRVDVPRMILEMTETKYKLTTVSAVASISPWTTSSSLMRQDGHLGIHQRRAAVRSAPRLTVTQPDGTVQHIWESIAIELYLGEKLGLLPTDLIERARAISIITSLRSLQEIIKSTGILPSLELRAANH
ncbi:hypothetical protein C8J56DRAFT_902523 [Mycena floridula]|nr:hypothetical protein C8J56DRAFT_902523 [Mycena floridula]